MVSAWTMSEAVCGVLDALGLSAVQRVYARDVCVCVCVSVLVDERSEREVGAPFSEMI